MTARVRVGISEFRVARSPLVLAAHGLGSCLGIALYDPERGIGGLAHAMLPAPGRAGDDRPKRFVTTVIGLMLEEMVNGGAARERLWAKLAGGANMFRRRLPAAKESVGERNVRTARLTLQALGIPLAGADVGGRQSRVIDFDLQTGQVQVYFPRERDKFLVL